MNIAKKEKILEKNGGLMNKQKTLVENIGG